MACYYFSHTISRKVSYISLTAIRCPLVQEVSGSFPDYNYPLYRYRVRWLDDKSQEVLDWDRVSPFLLSFNVRYDDEMADTYVRYQNAVEAAENLALRQLLP